MAERAAAVLLKKRYQIPAVVSQLVGERMCHWGNCSLAPRKRYYAKNWWDSNGNGEALAAELARSRDSKLDNDIDSDWLELDLA